MPVVFQCPACGGQHHCRVCARDNERFAALNSPLGSILEPCPDTLAWVQVGPENRRWIQFAADFEEPKPVRIVFPDRTS
ncbi:MAG: hypothetical protein ACR2F9_09145 [Longimicrobiaceae bacterium]|jgi:hypothetical protein